MKITRLLANIKEDGLYTKLLHQDKKDDNGVHLFYMNIQTSYILDLLFDNHKIPFINKLSEYSKNIVDIEFSQIDNIVLITIIEIDRQELIRNTHNEFSNIISNNEQSIKSFEKIIKEYENYLPYDTENIYKNRIELLTFKLKVLIDTNNMLKTYI